MPDFIGSTFLIKPKTQILEVSEEYKGVVTKQSARSRITNVIQDFSSVSKDIPNRVTTGTSDAPGTLTLLASCPESASPR